MPRLRGARQGRLRAGRLTGRDPYPVAARDLLRNTLLDAARDLLRERSWSAITMAEVARAGGVSRQTLYNEFGTRQEFVQALVLREGDRFLTAVEDAIAAHVDDPPAALSAAFDVFLKAAADDPVVRAAVSGDAEQEVLPLVTTRGQPLVAGAAERLATMLCETWPHATPDDARLLAECLVRLAISYAALPSGPAELTAESIRRLLGPFVERALGEG